MTTTRKFEVLRHGRWSSGDASGFLWIIRQNWDQYHEDFYDTGPDLNDEGWAYYVLYGSESDVKKHASRSHTCFSEAEAVRQAESAARSLTWD